MLAWQFPVSVCKSKDYTVKKMERDRSVFKFLLDEGKHEEMVLW